MENDEPRVAIKYMTSALWFSQLNLISRLQIRPVPLISAPC